MNSLTRPSRRRFLQDSAAVAAALTTTIACLRWAVAAEKERAAGDATDCDVFVYGSTPGGVSAAVEAARRGCRVVLACPYKRPGGMAASGLSTTDAVRPELFGGIVAEFIGRVRTY